MYYEDYEIGKVFNLKPVEFTEEGMIDFAKKYDPRWFHIDKEAAKESIFGGIIASGFHTLIECWSVWVKTGLDHEGLICGIGIKEAEWLKPVYPGDILTGELTVLEKQRRDGSDKGSIKEILKVKNQKGEETFEMTVESLVKCRE